MTTVISILFLLLFTYLSIVVLYLFIVALAGLKAEPSTLPHHPVKKKIAVLFTSYRSSKVIVQSAKKALQHNYPPSAFTVFVAGDHLDAAIIRELQQLPVDLSLLAFPAGSKARSLNYLLNKIAEDDFDVILILDEDNVMMPDVLEKINAAFHARYKAVQAHRAAKNKNSRVAILDAVSEEVNNHLFRASQNALGLSASLIGSGMAFEPSIIRRIYNKPGILDNPACDREVDFELLKHAAFVKYLHDATVLDEKVAGDDVYRRQRRRWMESQLFHLQLFFSRKEIVPHKSKDYWNKLFINLILPRLLLLLLFAVAFVCLALETVLQLQFVAPRVLWWLVLFVLFITTLCISIPQRLWNRATLMAFLHLPGLLLSFISAAAGVKRRQKHFVHTPKTYTSDTDFRDPGRK